MDAETLLTEFFGGSNRLTLEAFAQKRALWLETLRKGRDRSSISFLPFLSDGSRMTWYAVGPPTMQAGELLELCRGFVGPSYAEGIDLLEGSRTSGHHEQALVAFVTTCSGQVGVVDLGVLDQARREDADNVAAAFERLGQLIESRPPWSGYSTRSLAQVLADLDLALAERDLQGAEDLLVEVERSHSISEVNLQFLRIRMLQAVGRSAEVLDNPQLGYLIHARRPRKVTRALLEAAYDVHLTDVPLEGATLKIAGMEILTALGPAAIDILDPGTIKEATSLLAAGLAHGRGRTELQHVLDWLEKRSNIAGLSRALFPENLNASEPAAKVAKPTPIDELAAAAKLVYEGRPVEALALLKQQRPSVRAARLAFHVDVLLSNLDSADLLLRFGIEVLDHLDELGDDRVIQRLDQLTMLLPPVQAAAESSQPTLVAVPSSWQEWVERLETGADLRALHGLAELGASSWTADAASADAIAHAVQGLRKEEAAAVRSCAGTIVDAHADNTDAESSLALRAALLELVAISGLPTTQELRAIVGWVESIMSASVDSETVGRTLDALDVFASEHPTPALAEALADLAAIVAHHASAGARGGGFVMQVIAAVRASGSASDRAVRMTAARAAADVGAPVHPEDDFWRGTQEVDDWMDLLSGLHVGIHTLMGSVANRARATLEPRTGHGLVTTNEDVVATEQLRKLAAGSDIMILVTAAAKHSASEEIERSCPESRLVRVASKGLSSLLRELEKHLRSQQGAVKKAA